MDVVVGARADGHPPQTNRRTPGPPGVPGTPPARRRIVRPRRPPGRGRPHPGRLPPDRQPLAPALAGRRHRRPAEPWRTGPRPQGSDAQLEQAEQALLKGAKAHGFDTDLWTLDRIAEVIWRVTGCVTTPRRCGGCCAIGWTGACNAPPAAPKSATSRRSASGSPATGPGSKKRQARQGRHLLLGRVRRLADSDRALDLGAPRQDSGAGPSVQLEACLDRRRVVLWLRWWRLPARLPVQPGSDNTDSLIGVLGELRRFLGGQKATVLWDGLPAHRSNKMRAFIASQRHCWWWSGCPAMPLSSTRPRRCGATSRARAARSAYLAGDTLEEVIGAAQRGIDRVRRTPHLPYSLLRHSGLDLWQQPSPYTTRLLNGSLLDQGGR